jgi:hypothetical protein
MQQRQLKLTGALLFTVGLFSLQAQSTISASGGNASGSGGTASYTVGQVVYTTNTGANGSVAQGVQQPYEISVVTGIEEAKDISLDIVIYPNPAIDYIRLKIANYAVENLSYQLYDIKGNLLLSSKIETSETNIVLSSLMPSTYLLKVIAKKNLIKTFKVIIN